MNLKSLNKHNKNYYLDLGSKLKSKDFQNIEDLNKIKWQYERKIIIILIIKLKYKKSLFLINQRNIGEFLGRDSN